MKPRFKQIRRLSYPNKWLFLKGLFLAIFLRVCFKISNFKRTLAFLSRFKSGKTVVQNEGNEVKRYHHLITLTYGFGPWIVNCLSVCTAYWWLLKRRGISTDLKFGMKKEDEKLLAHAWLEYDGKSFTEEEIEEEYTAFKEPIL